MRVVITGDVVCRAEPGRSGAQVQSFEVGQTFRVEASQELGGEVWYRGKSDYVYESCWVYGPLTTPYDASDPAIALLAVSDYALARRSEAEFEDYVAVENLILDPPFRFDLDASPVMRLRLFQVIDRAARKISSRQARFSPFQRSWLLTHRERLQYWEPGAYWFMDSESLWELYEIYADSPAADEIAWVASQRRTSGGSDGEPDAPLRMVIDGPMQYWRRQPAGAWIRESLRGARPLIMMAVNTACNSGDYAVTKEVADLVLESLQEVRAEAADELVEGLARSSRECSRTPG